MFIMTTKKENSIVAIIQTTTFNYPNSVDPPKNYPEFSYRILHNKLDECNICFEGLRTAFKLLEYDKKNIDTSEWNPLVDIIKPGNTVLLKPNFVLHKSLNKASSMDVMVTNPSIIFAVLDYVILALKEKGRIIIGDSPIQEADFNEILSKLKLNERLKQYKSKTKIPIEIVDFRKEKSINKKHREIQRFPLNGDPLGYSTIDLGNLSEFHTINDKVSLFRVTNYDKDKMNSYHNAKQHTYVIANSAIKADVIISLPKLKTHKKAGITCALKNLVGINGSKDCLPHHLKGSYQEGGDEYNKKSFRKKLHSNIEERRAKSKSRFFCFFIYLFKILIYISEKLFPYKDPVKQGNWYGNKTIPKTIVDLNYILKFVSKDGQLTSLPSHRKFLTITDAVIAGEGEGPLHPTGKQSGIILVSQDFLANDIIASYIAGFNPTKIPTINLTLESKINVNNIFSVEEINIISNDSKLKDIHSIKGIFKKQAFKPSIGWKGNIEID